MGYVSNADPTDRQGFAEGRSGKRTQGWSHYSLRNNARWLQMLDQPELVNRLGFFVTLTFRDVPDTPEETRKVFDNWWKRMQKRGADLLHWVMEMQVKDGRRCPHYHCMVYFSEDAAVHPEAQATLMVDHWLDLTQCYHTHRKGQDVREIGEVETLRGYVAKHADKKFSDAQRKSVNLPRKWQGRTLGMWGKSGPWPKGEAITLWLDRQTARAIVLEEKRKTLSELQGKLYQAIEKKSPRQEYLARSIEYVMHSIRALEVDAAGSSRHMPMSRFAPALPEHSTDAVFREVYKC